jgi:CubicO group peptidase (beta-lactamase class C family)
MRSLPAEATPGTRFNYNTGNTYVLACVISAVTSKSLAEYMSETYWAPLGMEFDAFNTLKSERGREIGGSRAGRALRDIGRFGAFLLGNAIRSGSDARHTAGKMIQPRSAVRCSET